MQTKVQQAGSLTELWSIHVPGLVKITKNELMVVRARCIALVRRWKQRVHTHKRCCDLERTGLGLVQNRLMTRVLGLE